MTHFALRLVVDHRSVETAAETQTPVTGRAGRWESETIAVALCEALCGLVGMRALSAAQVQDALRRTGQLFAKEVGHADST